MTELLPPLLARDRRCVRLWTLWQRLLERIDLAVLLVADEAHVHTAYFPYLAEERDLLGTPAWQLAEGDEPMQRAVLASANEVNRHRGTPWALKESLRALGTQAEVIEWWQTEPPMPVHTFELVLDVGRAGNTQVRIATLIAEVARVKPARSHFTVTQAAHAAGTVSVTGIGRAMTYQRLVLTTSEPEST